MGFVSERRRSGLAVLAGLTLSFALGAVSAALAQGPGPGHGGGPRGGAGQLRPQGFSAAPQGKDAGPPADMGRSLRDLVFGSHGGDLRSMPPVARFRLDDGDGFVLERGAGGALLKFEDSPEVWALTATAGPRGDTIFKNDVGEPVLRMTRLGGMTLFTGGRPEGLPASVVGAASSVRPSTGIGPEALFRMLAQSSARSSRTAQHLITFEAPNVAAKADWLFADAAIVAAEAFVRLCSQAPDGRALAQRFGRVVFLTGGTAQAETYGSVVQITLAPGKGVAGRPSSERIYLVLRRR